MSELLRRKLQEKLSKGSYPSFWSPKNSGDELVGQVLRIRPSTWNPDIKVYEVKSMDGTVYSTPNNAVLNRLLAESKACVGDYIMIRYEGSIVTGRGRKAKDFSVSAIPKDEAEQILSGQVKLTTPLEIKPTVTPVKPELIQEPKTVIVPPKIKPAVPDEVVNWVKEMFTFYDEMEIERLQHYMNQRGYKYPVDVVVEVAGLKIIEGKVVK